jgi:hypothetical protein
LPCGKSISLFGEEKPPPIGDTSSGLRPRGLVRARSLGPLRAFGSTELLSPFPKRLKSPHPMRRRNDFGGQLPRVALALREQPWANFFCAFSAIQFNVSIN